MRRDTIANVSEAQRKRWQARAITIQRKVETLMAEALGWLGEDHALTDCIDNVLHQAENLTDALRPQESLP